MKVSAVAAALALFAGSSLAAPAAESGIEFDAEVNNIEKRQYTASQYINAVAPGKNFNNLALQARYGKLYLGGASTLEPCPTSGYPLCRDTPDQKAVVKHKASTQELYLEGFRPAGVQQIFIHTQGALTYATGGSSTVPSYGLKTQFRKTPFDSSSTQSEHTFWTGGSKKQLVACPAPAYNGYPTWQLFAKVPQFQKTGCEPVRLSGLDINQNVGYRAWAYSNVAIKAREVDAEAVEDEALEARQATFSPAFTMNARKSGAPFDGLSLQAFYGGIWMGVMSTTELCPAGAPPACQNQMQALFKHKASTQEAFMDVLRTGGQQMYVKSNGALSYSSNGAATVPSSGKKTQFKKTAAQFSYSLNGAAKNFMACKGTTNNNWQVYVKVPGFTKTGCTPFQAFTYNYPNVYRAWAYTN